MLQNQGDSVIIRACAVGVDLINTATGERRELFDDRAVDENPQTMTADRTMLQRSAIDHHLARLIGRSLQRGSQRHLLTGPGHVEMRHILDAKRDSHKCVRALQSDPIHGIVDRFGEEVGLARRVWRVCTMAGQRVRQGQGSAKATTVTVTTPTGHLCTVAGLDCSLRQRSLGPDTASGPTLKPARGVPSGR